MGFSELDATHLDPSNFANSLIITRDGFANYQHTDFDAIPIAYGLWWVGRGIHTGYSIDPALDHGCVQGGQFIYGEYGWGVDFEKYVSVHMSSCQPF